MDGPPTYAGTRGRAPCKACNGTGTDPDYRGVPAHISICLACNGTRVQPFARPDAALRASGRIAGIRRAQRAR